MNRKIKKNIKLDYFFRFLCNFAIVDGFFVLYLEQKGLSLWQIGILEGNFHVTSLITEIPSGALADLLGRKRVLLISRLCGIISSLIMIFSSQMFPLAIGFVFTAWGYNLLSGSEEALLYDSFLELDIEEKYLKTNGRLQFIAELSQGLAIFIGGFLAEHSYLLCYYASIIIELLAFFICCMMTEPHYKSETTEKKVSVKKHFITSYHLIKDSRELRYILVHYSILFAFQTSVFFYCQEYYFSKGIVEGEIGLIILLTSICSSIGALLSEWLSKKLKHCTCYIIGLSMALGYSLMSYKPIGISILGFAISSMMNSALYPLQSKELNKRIPSEQRATIISVSSMCFSMAMILLFPSIGFFADYLDLGKIILLLGVILLIYSSLNRPSSI